jgi:hypothetical protein
MEHNLIQMPESSALPCCAAQSMTIVQAILSVNQPLKIVSARNPMSAPTVDVSFFFLKKFPLTQSFKNCLE